MVSCYAKIGNENCVVINEKIISLFPIDKIGNTIYNENHLKPSKQI